MNTVYSENRQFPISGIYTAVAAAIVAVVLAHWRGASAAPFHTLAAPHLAISYVIFGVVCAFAWRHFAFLFGVYSTDRGFVLASAFRVFLCSLAMTSLLGIYISTRQGTFPVGRELATFLCAAFVCGLLMLAIRRTLGRPQRVIIFGSGRLASKAWREIRTRERMSRQLVGFVDVRPRADMPPDIADRYVGNMDNLHQLIVAEEVDELIVAVPLRSNFDAMQRASSIAQALGTRVMGLKDVCAIRHITPADDRGDIFIELVPSPYIRGFKQDLKRMLDIILAATGVLIGLPVLIALAVRSRLRSSNPAMEPKLMMGFRRKQFSMYSFRCEPGSALQRVGIGRLPQLWNVLWGDMSLVGPPPLSRIDIDRMDLATLECRFNVRPGLISESRDGRCLENESEERSLGSEYITGWSLLGDLRILARAFTTESSVPRVAGAEADAL